MIQYEDYAIVDADRDLQTNVKKIMIRKGNLVKLLFVPNGVDPVNELHMVHMKPMDDSIKEHVAKRPEGMYVEVTGIDRRVDPNTYMGVMRNSAYSFNLNYGEEIHFTQKEIRAVLQQP